MYLEDVIKVINDKLTILEGKQNIVLWGASENTVRLFQYTNIVNYKISIIVDNEKHGEMFWGKHIMSPDQIEWELVEAVVISAFYREDDIFNELIYKYKFSGLILKLNSIEQKQPFYQHLMKSEMQLPLEYSEIIGMNKKFLKIHAGERIFIIGNGPSIKDMDLRLIKNEKKMVVSNFCLHKDYKILKPEYYCFPQFTYCPLQNEEFYYEWLRQIGENSGNPQFFFNISEKKLIDQCKSFENKKINYIYLDSLNVDYYDDIDITGKMMMGQSVPIDCIQIAIYMGFKEIYLVGIEHSELVTRQYNYFYKREKSIMGDKDPSVFDNGKVCVKFQIQLHILDFLWKQYERLKEISEGKGIKIYNATKGGVLDVFERVKYEDII